jgi:hypothetical protein
MGKEQPVMVVFRSRLKDRIEEAFELEAGA